MDGFDLVAADLGGTHARFALARLAPGERPRLGPVTRLRVADHDGLRGAWQAFAGQAGVPLPRAAAIGVAAPLGGNVLRFVNSPWTIDVAALAGELGLERLTLLNDFGAMAEAVAVLGPDELRPLHGPPGALPAEGVTTVLGPGTGLGVAILLRRAGQRHVIETEASHIGFAPLGQEEEALAAELRERHGRASVERVVSGPGLFDLYRLFGGGGWDVGDAAGLWSAALAGSDSIAEQALDQLVKAFGSVAGDLALAHGANAVVIAGGLSNRMAARLASPLFAGRFIAKGRYRARMEGIPVRLATHEEPGLLGAAAAFQREHGPWPKDTGA